MWRQLLESYLRLLLVLYVNINLLEMCNYVNTKNKQT